MSIYIIRIDNFSRISCLKGKPFTTLHCLFDCMNSTSDFECLKCGACCRNLLQDYRGVRKGLTLTVKECNLFPKETVSPQLAMGASKPTIPLTYQLTVNVCPYINSQNECSIYDKRPLVCRAFPIVADEISSRCRVFSYRRTGKVYNEGFPMSEMKVANEKLRRYTQSHYSKHAKKGVQVWEYDLATEKWLRKTE